MKKIILIVTFSLALLIIAAALGAFAYVFAMESSAKTLYNHRNADTDGDEIADSIDDDVDGDGILNMDDSDADADGIPNVADALKAARKLIGRPYDQFNELTVSPMTKYGAIVCIDVVLYSYEQSGIYFEKEMRDFYKKKPRIFSDRGWNNPYDKNFARRVRNFRPYCSAKGFILEEGAALQPGDLVIFSGGHIAMIEKVKGSDFITIESSSKKIITKRTKKADIMKRSTERYGKDVYFARLTWD